MKSSNGCAADERISEKAKDPLYRGLIKCMRECLWVKIRRACERMRRRGAERWRCYFSMMSTSKAPLLLVTLLWLTANKRYGHCPQIQINCMNVGRIHALPCTDRALAYNHNIDLHNISRLSDVEFSVKFAILWMQSHTIFIVLFSHSQQCLIFAQIWCCMHLIYWSVHILRFLSSCLTLKHYFMEICWNIPHKLITSYWIKCTRIGSHKHNFCLVTWIHITG